MKILPGISLVNARPLGIPKQIKFLFVTLICVSVVYYGMYEISNSFTDYSKEYIDYSDVVNVIDTEGCKIPNLNPFDPSILQFYEKLENPLPKCYEEPFLILKNNTLILNERRTRNVFGENVTVRCVYNQIIRNPENDATYPDNSIGYGETKKVVFGKFIKEEYVRVNCSDDNDENKTSLFHDYFAMMRLKSHVEERCDTATKKFLSDESLNILLIGIDSTSKLNFYRQFVEVRNYMLEHLQFFDFKGYVKVGDNTFPNMVPILAGHFVDDYGGEDAFSSSKFADVFSLIWKNFSDLGYRTFYIEDAPNMHTFNYAKAGFNNTPTDYYFRPFTKAVERDAEWRKKNGYYCFGSRAEARYFYNYTLEFIRTMKDRPFFALTFLARETHDYVNQGGYLDEPARDFLKELETSGALNKSVVFFFSDHGVRFGGIRETYIGKIEERMPFMFQLYPMWFLKKHPDFEKSLTINQDRLITPFDIHRTMKDILFLSSKNYTFQKEHLIYGQSLFKEVQANRTCSSAHISAHWCTCYKRVKLEKDNERAIQVASAIVDSINNMTSKTTSNNINDCEMLEVQDIIDVFMSVPMMLTPSNYNKTTNESAEYAENMAVIDYLVTVKTSPGDAMFEGTIRLSGGLFSVVGEISRINLYKDQSWCTDNHRLKKYCFCGKNSAKVIGTENSR